MTMCFVGLDQQQVGFLWIFAAFLTKNKQTKKHMGTALHCLPIPAQWGAD